MERAAREVAEEIGAEFRLETHTEPEEEKGTGKGM
jgi:hypothetical protein